MRRNAKTAGLLLERTCKTVRAVTQKQIAEAVEHLALQAGTERKYTARVQVIDPEDHEVFRLTTVGVRSDLYDNGYTTPDINAVLEYLVKTSRE